LFFFDNMKINRRVILLALAALVMVSCGRKGEVKEFNIIPQPTYVIQQHGTFTLSNATKLCFLRQGQNDGLVKYVTSTLRKMHLRLNSTGTVKDNCIVFRIDDSMENELGKEGYRIEVREKGISIVANSEMGLFYGFQTFLQMLPADAPTVRYSKISVPQCTIKDVPRFSWRGGHLDVSRHFFSVKEVKQYIDLLAQYKMNKFHWHLTDDHGWRIQIEKYPRLNDVGSWRVDRDNVPWGEAEPAKEGESADYGGFYTKEEIADVVAYAAERHIEVIPEIEMPGHCAEILASYPQFACAGDDTTYQVQIGPYWPPRAILCAGNDSVLQFLRDVMDEVIPLFPSKYVHIGGDEALKDNWKRCPLCQQRIRQKGLKDEEELQGWMIRQVEDYLRGKGKSIVGWDEILQGGVSAEATVMSWQGMQGGVEAAKRGNPVIMTPTEYCYLDYVQGNPAYQPAAMPHEVTLFKAYQFDPMPKGLTVAEEKNVIGGQANLWTEYVNTWSHAQYMLLPRMCAISECLWSQSQRKNWLTFRHKVAWHKQRLAAQGFRYCDGSFRPRATMRYEGNGTFNVTLESEVEGTQLFYAIGANPTEPNVGTLYVEPFQAREGDVISVVSYYADSLREEIYNFEVK
ncbi:MAG: beta-N-acetylhexosaminidase, partial [Bacteroidales bacterium]|nr:beta-N-acetylhexosaminidase [Bacteroidales bacterium]